VVGSSWVDKSEIGMKIIVRAGSLFRISWLSLGFLCISCNLISNTTVYPTPTVTSSLAGTEPTQPFPQTSEPVMSVDMSANQGSGPVLTALIWLPEGKFAFAGSGGISLYRLPDAGIQPQAVPAFQSQVTAENPTLLTSTPDGEDLVWISSDRTVVYWDTSQAVNAATIGTSDSPITGLALNPNKKDLAYSTLMGEVLLWDLENQSIIQKWRQKAWLSDLSFSPEGQYLAGVDPSSFSAIIYTLDGQVVKRLEWTEAVFPSLLGAFFSPDWMSLAWVSQSVVQFMDVATGKATVMLSHEDAIGTVAWAPNSSLFATSSTINQAGDIAAVVLVWDASTGKLINTYPQTSPVQSITFAPDNLSLAVLDVDGQLHIWSLE